MTTRSSCFTLAVALLAMACNVDDRQSGQSSDNLQGIPETCLDPADPAVRYMSSDPVECAALTFQCGDGEDTFDDACGCGCVGTAPEGTCQDPSQEAVTFYIEGVSACAASTFMCGENESSFEDACGCGCLADDDTASTCADPDDDAVVWYIDDPLTCAAILYSCEPGEQAFEDACGCGCELAP